MDFEIKIAESEEFKDIHMVWFVDGTDTILYVIGIDIDDL